LILSSFLSACFVGHMIVVIFGFTECADKKMMRITQRLSYVKIYITKVMTRNPLRKEMCCHASIYAGMTSDFFT
jgi:hypothetical protein